jgi:multiple sugar transport system substrate-binding protein
MLPNAAGTWQEFMPFVWQNGGDVVDANGNPTLNSPQVIEALDQYTAFYKQGLAPKNATQGFAVESGFIAGDYGMFFSGPWHVGILNDTGKRIKGKWAIAPMPRRQAGTSFVGGSNLVVFNATKNKDAAWKFVEFEAKPETQALWYKTVADLPSNKAAWNSGDLAGQEELQVFRTQLEDAKSAPNVATWEQLATKLNDHIERAALGKTTPAEAAAAMQQDAQTLLQR